MQIEVVRSGGIGNIVVRRAVDTEELAAEEAAEVEALVNRIDLDELSARSPIRGRGADRFQYDLVVTRGDTAHQVSISEGETTPELRDLLGRLLERGSQPPT